MAVQPPAPAPPPASPTRDAMPIRARLSVISEIVFNAMDTQRAAPIGDYKSLKILDNSFLFNVAEDPLGRANLKERRKDADDRIVAGRQAWNGTMLPEVAGGFTESYHRRAASRPFRQPETEWRSRSHRIVATGGAIAVTVIPRSICFAQQGEK
jgi:hypothetical protein